jgi:hypothetical protein
MSSESEAVDPEPTHEGPKRAAWLASRASSLARIALAFETIVTALQVENAERCKPPLEQEEVRRVAERAFHYARTELLHRKGEFAQFAHSRLLNDLEIESLPALVWQIDSVLPKQSVALLYGSPGVGKTFVGLDMGFCVQTGSDWQGRPVRKGTVVYVIGEGSSGLPARVRAWKQARAFSGLAGVQFQREPLQLLRSDQVQAFIDTVGPHGPELVVFDTLARCLVGGDEDSARDMGLVIENVERLRMSLQTTVLLVHHPTKDGRAERGSGALRGAVDTALRLTVSDGVVTLRCEKQKDAGPFANISLALQPMVLPDGSQSCVVVDSLPAQRPAQSSAREGRILTALTSASSGMTKAEVQAALPDVKERTLFRWLRELRDEGLITLAQGVYRIAR